MKPKTPLLASVSVAVLIGLEASKINSNDVGTFEHGKTALYLTKLTVDPADMPGLLAKLDGRKDEIIDEDGPYTEQAVQAIDKVIYALGDQVRTYSEMFKRFDAADSQIDLAKAGRTVSDDSELDQGALADAALADQALANGDARPKTKTL
jgi:hypothetical protein